MIHIPVIFRPYNEVSPDYILDFMDHTEVREEDADSEVETVRGLWGQDRVTPKSESFHKI